MREAKPEWADIPPTVVDALHRITKSPVIDSQIIWGGFAPNATLAVTCKSGARYFIKGTPPTQTERGKEITALEIAFYENDYLPAGVSPAFYGSVSMDDWILAVFELIERGEESLPWTEAKYRAVFKSMDTAYQHNKNRTSFAPYIRNHIRHVDEIDELDSVLGSADATANTARIFTNPTAAAAWLTKYANPLRTMASSVKAYTEFHTLLHCDLRHDNVVFDTSGNAKLVDWAWPTSGPLAFDVMYFTMASEADGGMPVEKALDLYKEVTGISFARDGVLGLMALYAVAYGGWAPLPATPAMPRLRPMQGLYFSAMLGQVARMMGWNDCPQVDVPRLWSEAKATALTL